MWFSTTSAKVLLDREAKGPWRSFWGYISVPPKKNQLNKWICSERWLKTVFSRSITALRINTKLAVSYSQIHSQPYLRLLCVTPLAELKRSELEPAVSNFPLDPISKAWCICTGCKVTCLHLLGTGHRRQITPNLSEDTFVKVILTTKVYF